MLRRIIYFRPLPWKRAGERAIDFEIQSALFVTGAKRQVPRMGMGESRFLRFQNMNLR